MTGSSRTFVEGDEGGEGEGESSATTGSVIDGDFTAMRLDERSADCQADAG